jgi:hypothetical protein
MEDANNETMKLPMRVFEVDDGFDSSLENFISGMKLTARHNFLRNGELPVMFFLLSEQRSDGRHLITQVMCECSNMEKAAVMHAVKGLINAKDDDGDYLIKSFVQVAEAWVGGKDRTVRPSKDPNRIEVVTVFARERGRHDGLFAMAKIKRHALSPKPGLDEWEEMNNSEMKFDMFDDDTAARTVH